MSKPADLVQGTLDLLLLKIVALEPLHAWAISQRLKQISGEVLQVSDGSLYPALHKLEQEGWIILIEKKLGKANRYEVIEHEAYVAAHPDSCPPMKYVDALMADVTGMEKYGPATREAGAIPDNFSIDKKLREAAEEAGWLAIAEYLRNLSPEIRARIVEHLKQRNQR